MILRSHIYDGTMSIYKCSFESVPENTSEIENNHKQGKKKVTRKIKAGTCEICDVKFDDEDAHIKTSQHQSAVIRKRPQFKKESSKKSKSC